jgi:hypothetical protein
MRTGDQEEKTSAQVLGTDSAADQTRAGEEKKTSKERGTRCVPTYWWEENRRGGEDFRKDRNKMWSAGLYTTEHSGKVESCKDAGDHHQWPIGTSKGFEKKHSSARRPATYLQGRKSHKLPARRSTGHCSLVRSLDITLCSSKWVITSVWHFFDFVITFSSSQVFEHFQNQRPPGLWVFL